MLTGQRKTEIAKLSWQEIQENCLELLPSRSKNQKHISTPLSEPAKELISSLENWDNGYLFSTTKGVKSISCFTQIKSKLFILTGTSGWTFHDFRRSMATLLEENGFDRFSVQCVLNHTDRSVTGIYDRSEHLRRKQNALDKWADILSCSSNAAKNIINF